MQRVLRLIPAVCFLLLLASWIPPAQGEDAPATAPAAEKAIWSDEGEFALVMTAGNSESMTAGLRNTLKRVRGPGTWTIGLGAIWAESTAFTRYAVGSDPSDYKVIDESDTKKTAESYFLRGLYEHKVRENFFWFGNGGWDRNQFAGIQNRYTLGGGVGNIWRSTEKLTWKTGYGLAWTHQEDVVENPDVNQDFLDANAASDLSCRIGGTTVYTNVTVLRENLNETSDLRIDMTNAVTVSMTKRLGLKAALQFLFDNEPSYEELGLENPPGTPTGYSVLYPLDDLDTIFTTSLVVKF